jgi:peptidoglycan/xylan/chitin deacetylase (PgdA/CDA1 family)
MAYLAKHFRVLSVGEVAIRLSKGDTLPDRTVAITIDDGFQDAYTHAYPILRELGLPATMFLPIRYIDGNTAGNEGVAPNVESHLCWNQVREMCGNGIEFGSHSMTHPSLAHIGKDEMMEQLSHSRMRLEEEIGKPVFGFAYPYGTFRHLPKGVEDLVRAAGYRWAFTTLPGLNRQGANPYMLKRTTIQRDDVPAIFKRIMMGALDAWIFVQRLKPLFRNEQ